MLCVGGWGEGGYQLQLYPLSLAPALDSTMLDCSGVGVGKWGGFHTLGTGGATDIVVATDWPPPVSASLVEEPVMYIGADSLGLIRMVAQVDRVVCVYSSMCSGVYIAVI